MYLNKVTKSTISAYDERNCYLNEVESVPWGCPLAISWHSLN